MTTIEFNEKIQPFLTDAGEFSTIDGREEMEQHLELQLQDALFGIISNYSGANVENKIRKEARTTLRQTDYVSDVGRIRVERINDDETKSGYAVSAPLEEIDDLNIILDNL